MHAPLSVVLFTVLSGAGYGLTVLFLLADRLALGGPVGGGERLAAGLTAVALITVGLLFSTGHLARPRRAWRSLFRVRTSWLSREAALALLFYPVAGGFVAAYGLSGWAYTPLVTALAVLTGLLAAATLIATGMIYACVQAVREWHQGLTPVNYLVIGLALGAGVLTLIRAAAGADPAPAAALGAGLLLTAAVTKAAWYAWNAVPGGAGATTATGLSAGPVRLLDSGESAASFLAHEFLHPLAGDRRRGRYYRGLVLLGGFLLPAAGLAVVAWSGSLPWAAAALALAFAGALVERWLLFAEARHAVRLYYGAAERL
ncbi:dimethyl sulfoxide reductase anchor subunit family protein [Halorhodospira neutriphila]|uniref:DMSO reductase anchor subunit (DmsC) n=1 Tax=Halorhodospira neutriphila TaxID=168379 RepID=A0ABS1E3G9_9GAMM|nr:DmsC/YnfH family molybdoenzyme membrane anchor subunit [Halorhodospira neutriphila]MBK1726053.1 hypothetical protein [Halorhodospira neutriphila]